MQTAKKLLSLFTVTAMLFNFLTFFGVLNPVMAANLQGVRNRLSDPRAGQSSVHTFTFTIPTSSAIEEVRFQYATAATNTTKPTNLNVENATLGATSGLTNGEWTIDTTDASSGLLRIQHATGQTPGANTVATVPFNAVINSGINDCQGSVASSDTCYVRIQTSSTAEGAWDADVVDFGTTTYTVITAVSVTATVDPTMTFVIAPVGAGTTTNGVATSVASQVTSLPFGNLTAGTPKYAAHQLFVTTNANSGYTVTMRMLNQMTGSYSSNNIDPFVSTWDTPTTWTAPTGSSPNTNTGWIGANTNDADVGGFGSALFGPVNDTSNEVMKSNTSDNGTAGVYVTYALAANVYQPADTYTGAIVYTATPTY